MKTAHAPQNEGTDYDKNPPFNFNEMDSREAADFFDSLIEDARHDFDLED